MTMQRRIFFSVVLVALVAQVAIAREWSDATGKFKVEAELVKVAGDVAFLKKQSDGATIQVPITRLSAPDQAYLQSLQSPAPELVSTSEGSTLPLATAGCVGLIVVDPKPLLGQDAFGVPPLKDLLDQAVGAAGIDFRKTDRLTVYFLMPDLQKAMQSKQTNVVGVAEFSEPVDPTSMLSKIPTSYESMTIAGKTCHKPAANDEGPWVCVIDEKTLAFAADEESLAGALTVTSDDPTLTALAHAADAKNEIRFALNMAPMSDLLVQVGAAVPPEAAKALEVIKSIDSFTFTTDLDGAPSIELLIQVGEGTSAADVEKAIQDGLAQLPDLVKAGAEAAAKQETPASPMPMDPAMAVQMLGGMSEKIDELLVFEQQEAALKISVKFPPGTPPLAQTLVQVGNAIALMAGSGGPMGSGN